MSKSMFVKYVVKGFELANAWNTVEHLNKWLHCVKSEISCFTANVVEPLFGWKCWQSACYKWVNGLDSVVKVQQLGVSSIGFREPNSVIAWLNDTVFNDIGDEILVNLISNNLGVKLGNGDGIVKEFDL